ncbi:MAG TPA: glycosyltransferase [Chryseolinea sp.]|nr:glycosyltransferase [Chryseolinea sp.]
MATILFYVPFYRRARDVESLIIRFRDDGHRVLIVNQRPGSEFNDFLSSKKIECYEYATREKAPALVSFIKHLYWIARFCYRQNPDIVFSHLDSTNFVAAIAQYFVSAKIYLCRHHIDEAQLYGFNKSWTYKLTNLLARRIIVVSNRALRYMIDVEGVLSSKLIHINLAYDFSLYKLPETTVASSIRHAHSAEVLLITVCRLTQYKRPDLCVKIAGRLRDEGIHVTFLILGSGPMEEELTSLIKEHGLEQNVKLMGHLANPLDYISAADILVHPSVLESSCVVLKEAGLVRKPVIACSGVGDVDEYIEDGVHGMLLPPEAFEHAAVKAIQFLIANRADAVGMGEKLRTSVLSNFEITNVINRYSGILGEARRSHSKV